MKIVIAGGTGFMGRSLVKSNVFNANWVVLCRDEKEKVGSAKMVPWDGENAGEWAKELDGADVLINLSGKSVDCRYNDKNKSLIYASRLNSTRALGKALVSCQNLPKLWLNAASATIYRHSEDKAMDELTGEIGHGFSVDVCQQWEKAFFEFQIPGVRQVALRTAIVLGREGGALQPMKTLARFGLGGKMGPGNQKFSWVHEDDVARAIQFIIENDSITGPVNLSSPNPVDNAVLMKAIRQSIGIPFGIPSPVWLLKLGAMLIKTETELILKSRFVVPGKLSAAGFQFSHPHIEEAIADTLKSVKKQFKN